MALAREEINLEDIKRDAKIEALLQHVIGQDVEIANLKDEQFEMSNEIERRDEIISKIALLVVGVINVLFTFFMSR